MLIIMATGIGKALEKAISTNGKKPESALKSEHGKYELLNKNRQEILQFLCIHPCCYSTMISTSLGISLHACNWHLRRLIESDYISKKTLGKKTVYYPVNMIAIKDIPILQILNVEKAKSIYIAILDKDGITQKEICEKLTLNHQAVIWYAKKLEILGLISSLEDGKYRRYYPTGLLQKKKDENTKRLKNFKDDMIQRFKKERLAPTVLRSTEDKIVVRISKGGKKAVLTLFTDPFVSVLL
jgi:predicted transcriptional regulator